MPLLRQTAKRKVWRCAWRKNTPGRTALQCRRCGPPCGRFTRRRIRLPHGRSRRDVRLTRYRLSFTRASHPSPSSSRPRTTAFHAVDRGSNPLGDAKFGYYKERQGTKRPCRSCFLSLSCNPHVQPNPRSSKNFPGIFLGIELCYATPIPGF